MHRLLIPLVTTLLVMCSFGDAQTGQGTNCLDIKWTQEAQDRSLFQTLVYLEHQSLCPLLIEIAQPFPLDIILPAGSLSLRDSLNLISRQAPRYGWREDLGIVIFYDVQVYRSRRNPLNVRLKRFLMPDTLSDLKLYIPNAVSSETTGSGGLLNGLGVPESQDAPLRRDILVNVTVREVIAHALRGIGRGFSLVLFPNIFVRGPMLAMSNWTLMTGPELATFKMYMGSMPARRKVR